VSTSKCKGGEDSRSFCFVATANGDFWKEHEAQAIIFIGSAGHPDWLGDLGRGGCSEDLLSVMLDDVA